MSTFICTIFLLQHSHQICPQSHSLSPSSSIRIISVHCFTHSLVSYLFICPQSYSRSASYSIVISVHSLTHSLPPPALGSYLSTVIFTICIYQRSHPIFQQSYSLSTSSIIGTVYVHSNIHYLLIAALASCLSTVLLSISLTQH